MQYTRSGAFCAEGSEAGGFEVGISDILKNKSEGKVDNDRRRLDAPSDIITVLWCAALQLDLGNDIL